MPIVVLDTNILVAAMLRGGGTARAVVRACLRGHYQPVLGPALLAEYEDVLGREDLFGESALSMAERGELFDGFLNIKQVTVNILNAVVPCDHGMEVIVL